MTNDDKRNTIIVELSSKCTDSVPTLQGRSDDELIAELAMNTLIRETQRRTLDDTGRMSIDDQRNTLIVETSNRLGISINEL